MQDGACKLCLEQKALLRSHLLPRALYALCRTGDSEPIAIRSDVMMQTSRQTQDYLLCAGCEDLLNKRGETWLIPKLATWDKGFPFYDILSKVAPDVNAGDVMGYAAARNPDIDCEAITHFAMGIYWKASAHSWFRRRRGPLIDLGPYSETLDPELFKTCFYNNRFHPIVVSDFSKEMKELYRAQAAKAHKSRKLVEYFAKLKEQGGLPRT